MSDRYINTTPHSITLAGENGENPFSVEPSGWLVNACPTETEVESDIDGITLVKTTFAGDPETRRKIVHLCLDGKIILGSIIAAQAYPGLVFGLVPCKGFERVPPAEKRMRQDKFTVFPV